MLYFKAILFIIILPPLSASLKVKGKRQEAAGIGTEIGEKDLMEQLQCDSRKGKSGVEHKKSANPMDLRFSIFNEHTDLQPTTHHCV